MSEHTPIPHQLQFPFGKLCECGCGQLAPLAKQTDTKRGKIAGQPLRFVRNHHVKVQKRISVEERFWNKVNMRAPDECWPWIGGKNAKGYGCLRYLNRQDMAHRVSYILHHGSIPGGMQILHKCDNPSCVNPHHLSIGTAAENMQDCVNKGRHATQHGETNAFAKLSREQVIEIKQLLRDGLLKDEIAKKFSVTVSTIYCIQSGRTWLSVP